MTDAVQAQPSRLSALIQIIKVNDLKSGTKDGRNWELQDAECLLLNDDGTPQSVGVLSLPRNLRGANAPRVGTYTGIFTLQAGLRDRRIEAVLVGLSDASKRVPSPVKAA